VDILLDEANLLMNPTFIHNENWSLVDSLQDYRTIIMQMYFMMTSLSTVGFGDFYPVNDLERIIGSFLLLFGVIVFSYIMMKLADMIINFNELNGDSSNDSDIDNFILLIKKFN